ncbi:hypothetical protein Bca4012_036981 [Brassica carinata]|uniref:Uncharacterized protein n=1 Tax=Brassica carinata TaxID=52824 RepID=A0A8X7WD50_BRACI|nr:hypothetical protein Bca52824_010674 [Brassica carinata]
MVVKQKEASYSSSALIKLKLRWCTEISISSLSLLSGEAFCRCVSYEALGCCISGESCRLCDSYQDLHLWSSVNLSAVRSPVKLSRLKLWNQK